MKNDPFYKPLWREETLAEAWQDEKQLEIACHLWFHHLDWLEDQGWKRAKDVDSTIAEGLTNPQHRTLRWLSHFVTHTGLANAHVGLTSSDIEDNVWKCCTAYSLTSLSWKLVQVIIHLHSISPTNASVQGYTHLQKAMVLPWDHRLRHWTSPLDFLADNRPLIAGKLMSGPVGDQRGYNVLFESIPETNLEKQMRLSEQGTMQSFNWDHFNLDQPWNLFPKQSADYIDEFQAVSWVSQIVAQLHKIALDLRLLCGFGDISYSHAPGYIGSSSIKHKNNPIQLEKVCSISRRILNSPREILDVISNNALERTIDGSWQLRNCLQETFLLTDKIFDIFLDLPTLSVSNLSKEEINSDIITEEVVKGKSRWDALLKHKNL